MVFKVHQSSGADRRKYKRVKTQNLVSYFSFDNTGKLISHSLGIALDISKGGILLETTYPIESGLIVLAATDRERNLIEVKSKLVYSKKTSTGTYFKEYNYRGYNLFIHLHNQNPLPIPHKAK
jgi:c-di-GMP-binding flagellar brake protein YcgR